VPHIEAGIVGQHRAGSSQDGTGAPTPGVTVTARFRPCDPTAASIGKRGAPIERDGGLQPHPRSLPAHAGEEADVQFAGVGRERGVCQVDLNARVAQPPHAGTAHQWIRIDATDHDTSQPRRNQRVTARRRASVVRARLERNPCCAASS
jgi:hypothetical protein